MMSEGYGIDHGALREPLKPSESLPGAREIGDRPSGLTIQRLRYNSVNIHFGNRLVARLDLQDQPWLSITIDWDGWRRHMRLICGENV